MPGFNDQISQLVDNFVSQVSALARKAAMDALEGALSAAPRSSGPGRRAEVRSLRLAAPRVESSGETRQPSDQRDRWRRVDRNRGGRVRAGEVIGVAVITVSSP